MDSNPEIVLPPGLQVLWLFILALPIACVCWTITHEEIFREPREYCVRQSKQARNVFLRKLFYALTCEYCLSHYVTIAFLALSHFQLLVVGWQGYVIAGFALVWVANVYMSLYGYLRIDLKKERLEATLEEKKVVQMKVKEKQRAISDRPRLKQD